MNSIIGRHMLEISINLKLRWAYRTVICRTNKQLPHGRIHVHAGAPTHAPLPKVGWSLRDEKIQSPGTRTRFQLPRRVRRFQQQTMLFLPQNHLLVKKQSECARNKPGTSQNRIRYKSEKTTRTATSAYNNKYIQQQVDSTTSTHSNKYNRGNNAPSCFLTH